MKSPLWRPLEAIFLVNKDEMLDALTTMLVTILSPLLSNVSFNQLLWMDNFKGRMNE